MNSGRANLIELERLFGRLWIELLVMRMGICIVVCLCFVGLAACELNCTDLIGFCIKNNGNFSQNREFCDR